MPVWVSSDTSHTKQTSLLNLQNCTAPSVSQTAGSCENNFFVWSHELCSGSFILHVADRSSTSRNGRSRPQTSLIGLSETCNKIHNMQVIYCTLKQHRNALLQNTPSLSHTLWVVSKRFCHSVLVKSARHWRWWGIHMTYCCYNWFTKPFIQQSIINIPFHSCELTIQEWSENFAVRSAWMRSEHLSKHTQHQVLRPQTPNVCNL